MRGQHQENGGRGVASDNDDDSGSSEARRDEGLGAGAVWRRQGNESIQRERAVGKKARSERRGDTMRDETRRGETRQDGEGRTGRDDGTVVGARRRSVVLVRGCVVRCPGCGAGLAGLGAAWGVLALLGLLGLLGC